MASPLKGEPTVIVEAAISPSSITEKYSADENSSASSAMTGANPITRTMAKDEPTKEFTAVTNRASGALPCLASG